MRPLVMEIIRFQNNHNQLWWVPNTIQVLILDYARVSGCNCSTPLFFRRREIVINEKVNNKFWKQTFFSCLLSGCFWTSFLSESNSKHSEKSIYHFTLLSAIAIPYRIRVYQYYKTWIGNDNFILPIYPASPSSTSGEGESQWQKTAQIEWNRELLYGESDADRVQLSATIFLWLFLPLESFHIRRRIYNFVAV